MRKSREKSPRELLFERKLGKKEDEKASEGSLGLSEKCPQTKIERLLDRLMPPHNDITEAIA